MSRFDLKYSSGPLPHDKLMASIELYGRQVAPRVAQPSETDLRFSH